MTDEGHEIAHPDPEGLGTEPEFVLALKVLKAWSGLSFREIEAKAKASGLRLPFSTASGMLGRSTLPRQDLLIAFTTACGLDDGEVAAWVSARKRIAVALAGEPEPTPDCQPRPVSRRTSGWRRRVTVAVVAVVVAATTAAGTFGQFSRDVQVDVTQTTANPGAHRTP